MATIGLWSLKAYPSVGLNGTAPFGGRGDVYGVDEGVLVGACLAAPAERANRALELKAQGYGAGRRANERLGMWRSASRPMARLAPLGRSGVVPTMCDVKQVARLRTDLTTKALVQAPGALAAAGGAFVIYENPTTFEFALGVAVGAAFVGAANGWMIWSLHRQPLADRMDAAPMDLDAKREPADRTRRHHIARVPVYLALDVLVIAVFAIVGAGILVAATAASVLVAWGLTRWEERSGAVLYYERRNLWKLRPQKPYWYYERTAG